MNQYLSRFLYLVSDQKRKLIFLSLLFLSTSLLDTIGIGLIGPFIALANNPGIITSKEWLNIIYLNSGIQSEQYFVAFFGLLITIVFYIKSYLSFRVQRYVLQFSYTQKGLLIQRLLRAYLAAPYTFHLSRNTALLIQNITQETNSFCNGIMLPLLNSASYMVIIVFLGGLLIKTNLSATVFILGILLIPTLLYNHYKHRLSQWGKSASIAQVGIIRTINHGLGGIKETRVIGCEPYFEDQAKHYVEDFEKAVSASQTFKMMPRIVIEAILITFLVGFTSLFLLSEQKNQDLMSVLGIFAITSIRLIPAVSQITSSVASLRNYRYSLNKLYFDLKEVEAMNAASQPNLLMDGKSPQDAEITLRTPDKMLFKETIVLDQVSYQYPEVEEMALKEISLTIKRGEAIALIGKSGAGKTTLVDVILGLLQATSGDIQVDGVSVYQNLRAWQNIIGYIPQTIFLMDDTLEKNIAFGVPQELIDPQRLEMALQAAQLHELVQELPQGLKTMVGEKGVRLSGGQRQRVGIARALYHEREILVLDEATAALDNETERLVNEAIKSLSGTKTLIIIAHRLTTVEHCDRIYQLAKGQVVKSGSYREVVLGEMSLQ